MGSFWPQEEILLAGNSPTTWLKIVSNLYTVKQHSIDQPVPAHQLPRVSDHFGTMRKMIEVLNHDYNRYCDKNALPKQ